MNSLNAQKPPSARFQIIFLDLTVFNLPLAMQKPDSLESRGRKPNIREVGVMTYCLYDINCVASFFLVTDMRGAALTIRNLIMRDVAYMLSFVQSIFQ